MALTVFAPAAAADSTEISRSMPVSVYANEELTVTLAIEGLDAGGIIETIPDGFSFVGTTHPTVQTDVSGQHIVFSVLGEKAITYRLKAPSSAGSGTITGVWDNVVTQTNGTIPGKSISVSYYGSSDGGDSWTTIPTTSSPTNISSSAEEKRFFTFDGGFITSIALKAKGNVSKATILADPLPLPSALPAAPGCPAGYVNVTLSGINESALTGMNVGFRVNSSWVKENTISQASIALARYNGTWTLLPTTFVGSGDDILTFESEVPGPSLFAITGEKRATDAVPTKTPVTIALPKTTGPVPDMPAAAKKDAGGSLLPVVGGLVLLALICGAGFWYHVNRKRKGDEE